MVDRLLNETDTVVLLPARDVLGVPHVVTLDGLVPYTELTSDIINYWAAVTTMSHPNAGAGGNISCAIVADAFTLGLTDSEEDDERTLCDPGNSVDLTDLNFDADITGFRDAEPGNQDSVFELWRHLTFAPDIPYILVHRVGYRSDVPFEAGHEITAYYALTDLPVDVHADGAKQKIQSVFVPRETTPELVNHVLTA